MCDCAASSPWLSPSASRMGCADLLCFTLEGEISKSAPRCVGIQRLSHQSEASELRTSSHMPCSRWGLGRELLLTLKWSTPFTPTSPHNSLVGSPEKNTPHSPRVADAQRQQKTHVTASPYHNHHFSKLTPAISTLSLLGKKGSNFTPSHTETLRQPWWALHCLPYTALRILFSSHS